MPIPYQPLDIQGMIAGGARLAQAMRDEEEFKLQKEDRQYAKQLEEKRQADALSLRQAAAKWFNAPPEQKQAELTNIAALDPAAALKLGGYQTEQAGAALEQEKQAEELNRQSQVATAQVWLPILDAVEQNPDPNTFKSSFEALRLAKERGINVEPNMIADIAIPERRQAMRAAAAQTLAQWGPKPKEAKPFGFEGTARLAGSYLATWEKAPQLADPATGMAHPRWQEAWDAALAEEQKQAAAKGVKVVNMPPGSLPGTVTPQKTTLASLEDRILMYQSVRQKVGEQLRLIGSDEDDQYFGLEGDVKEVGAKVASYVLGSGTPEMVQKWQEGKQAIRSFGTMLTYDFLVALSGKAVTDAERRTIVKAVGDPDHMTLFEYRAAMTAMDKISSMAEQSAATQRELGINVATTPEQQEMANEAMGTLGADLASGAITQEQFMAGLAKAKVKYNATYAAKWMADKTGDARWTGGPKKGDRATIGGKAAIFDGKSWVEE